jgi:hypothetical protein
MLGLFTLVLMPIYGPITTAVFAPTVTKPEANPTLGTPEAVIDCAKATKCNTLWALPTFFHTWSQIQEAVDVLKELEFVVSYPLLDLNLGRHSCLKAAHRPTAEGLLRHQ